MSVVHDTGLGCYDLPQTTTPLRPGWYLRTWSKPDGSGWEFVRIKEYNPGEFSLIQMGMDGSLPLEDFTGEGILFSGPIPEPIRTFPALPMPPIALSGRWETINGELVKTG